MEWEQKVVFDVIELLNSSATVISWRSRLYLNVDVAFLSFKILFLKERSCFSNHARYPYFHEIFQRALWDISYFNRKRGCDHQSWWGGSVVCALCLWQESQVCFFEFSQATQSPGRTFASLTNDGDIEHDDDDIGEDDDEDSDDDSQNNNADDDDD